MSPEKYDELQSELTALRQQLERMKNVEDANMKSWSAKWFEEHSRAERLQSELDKLTDINLEYQSQDYWINREKTRDQFALEFAEWVLSEGYRQSMFTGMWKKPTQEENQALTSGQLLDEYKKTLAL